MSRRNGTGNATSLVSTCVPSSLHLRTVTVNGTLNYTFSCLANQTAPVTCTPTSCGAGACCMARSFLLWGSNQTLLSVCSPTTGEGNSSQAYAVGASPNNFTATVAYYQQCVSSAVTLLAGAVPLALLALL